MDILKGISLGAIICINDSLMRVAKNIKLFKPNMILMVPLMIETFAKKLEDVKDLPEKVVKEAVFGSQFHTICSGPKDLGTGKEQHITITAGSNMSDEDIDKAVKEAAEFRISNKITRLKHSG